MKGTGGGSINIALFKLINAIDEVKSKNTGINNTPYNKSTCNFFIPYPMNEMTIVKGLPEDIASKTLYVWLNEIKPIDSSWPSKMKKRVEKTNETYERLNKITRDGFKKYPYKVKFYPASQTQKLVNEGAQYFISYSASSKKKTRFKTAFERRYNNTASNLTTTSTSYYYQSMIFDFVNDKIHLGPEKGDITNVTVLPKVFSSQMAKQAKK